MRYSFIDEAKIFIQAGKGGNGSAHLRRERCVEFGGPDGGTGGKGGDVIFIADRNVNTLIAYRYQKHFMATNGEGGSGQCKFGAKGTDVILKVPIGTEIYDYETNYLMAQLNEEGEKIVLIEGGAGGIGNIFFKSSVNRTPRKAMPGFEGKSKYVKLVMKLLADVGLIGKPNAGKSSFLRTVTNSNAKVANYQFTTLAPNLGVVEVDNGPYSGFIIADLPGLIEGAANGKGLGTEFLKHIEKCEMLLHIIDVFGKSEDEIWSEYNMIRGELSQHNESLEKKEEIIVFNKIYMCQDKAFIKQLCENFKTKTGKKVFLDVGISIKHKAYSRYYVVLLLAKKGIDVNIIKVYNSLPLRTW
jgi:GTP-binding protein